MASPLGEGRVGGESLPIKPQTTAYHHSPKRLTFPTPKALNPKKAPMPPIVSGDAQKAKKRT